MSLSTSYGNIKMDHILIDSTFLINELKRKRAPHGIPRVILAYLEHYVDNIHLVYRVRHKLFILPRTYSKQIAQLLLQWDFKHYKTIVGLLIKGIVRAENTKKGECYFLLKLDQNGVKYPSYFAQLKAKGIKPIIMIHDLFPILYPEYSDPAYAEQFEKNIISSINNAIGLICVSQNTQNLLEHYLQSKNISCPPVIASPLAPGLINQETQQLAPLEGPYFVIVSTIVARKNHLLLLHIWRQLSKQLGENTPKLVIIGKRSAECSSTLAMMDHCQLIRPHIIETTATDKELRHYLTHATALLFPTFAEGYGLPLIEALSFNVPVLASDLTIFREIANNIPEYLDPIDGKGWLETILEYTQEHSSLRAAQLERLSEFTMPTWFDHFRKVNLFLARIASS